MLKLAGHAVRAVSVGGLETCIELPQYKLCFDIGRCPPTALRCSTVLFTHAHIDHMGGVMHHCATRDMMSMPPPTYLLPRENEADFHAMLAAWRRLSRSDLPCTVVPMSPGDCHDLGKGRVVRAFRAVHRVPSVGYAVCSVSQRLKPELRGTAGAKLAAMRRAGGVVDERSEQVEVVFCGDTTIDVVDREPLVRAARLLILEVTFMDDQVTVDMARAQGHVHLNEVVERAHLFDNQALLFTHRSMRFGNTWAEQRVRSVLPPELFERVTLLGFSSPWTG